uniref:C-type lectin domain-containing protein n=1 Tax=Anas platyrhynchos platyrhynchos TaxID=8840 RepID=A0A493TTV1_ANAPP
LSQEPCRCHGMHPTRVNPLSKKNKQTNKTTTKTQKNIHKKKRLLNLSLTPEIYLQVFQKAPTPPNALQNKSEAGGRSRTEVCMITSLLRYFCRVSHGSVSSPGHAGCKLCPQSWQLLGDQCYQVPKSTGTWMEGKKDCESRGSHLAVLRNTADMLTVWIGLKASSNIWKWVDNSSFDATPFSSLLNVENDCVTFVEKGLEYDGCGSNHKWVCQTEPFHLLSKTAGDRESFSACPEKPILQDSCC